MNTIILQRLRIQIICFRANLSIEFLEKIDRIFFRPFYKDPQPNIKFMIIGNVQQQWSLNIFLH